jgi:hypothetical protein
MTRLIGLAAGGPFLAVSRRFERVRAVGHDLAFNRRPNMLICKSFTGATGLEPATSGVTVKGRALALVAVGRRRSLDCRFPLFAVAVRGRLIATAAFQGRSSDGPAGHGRS